MDKMLSPDFSKYPDGLVPCVVQDNNTGKVLMLGFMNEAALQETARLNRVTFFSRSRQRLWTKGESSGNFLQPVSWMTDCDNDTILVKAIPAGPVCHTGAATCFGEENLAPGFLAKLEQIISDRKINAPAGSYISSLFEKGINKIAQKVGEEAVELVIEAKDNDQRLFTEEAADLLFHYLVLLNAKGISLAAVCALLEQRHDKK